MMLNIQNKQLNLQSYQQDCVGSYPELLKISWVQLSRQCQMDCKQLHCNVSENTPPVLIIRNDLRIDFDLLATCQQLNKRQGDAQDDLLHRHLIVIGCKTTIDFRDQRSLISLTKATLSQIFRIAFWSCPPNNLCPRVPCRVNYLLWINNFILKPKNSVNKHITVLDIGTGATLIYPLIGHKMFGWNFIAIQKNEDSFLHANNLIKLNNLEKAVQIYHEDIFEPIRSDSWQVVRVVSENEFVIDIAICNPPFYDSDAEDPKPISSMSLQEHQTEDGQYGFFFHIYRQSFRLHSHKKIDEFTCLLGRQTTFKEVVKFLISEEQQGVLQGWKRGRIEQGTNARFIIAWKPKTIKFMPEY